MVSDTRQRLRQGLRDLRQREFERLRRDRLPNPVARSEDMPLASAVCLLPDMDQLMQRIDRAQTAMEGVLQAWARDPRRRGAHLLARDGQMELPLEFAADGPTLSLMDTQSADPTEPLDTLP